MRFGGFFVTAASVTLTSTESEATLYTKRISPVTDRVLINVSIHPFERTKDIGLSANSESNTRQHIRLVVIFVRPDMPDEVCLKSLELWLKQVFRRDEWPMREHACLYKACGAFHISF